MSPPQNQVNSQSCIQKLILGTKTVFSYSLLKTLPIYYTKKYSLLNQKLFSHSILSLKIFNNLFVIIIIFLAQL
jgi:hypothetical protein